MALSLRTFLETGLLGGVALGMLRATVAELLGPPDELGGTSRRHPQPAIWRYGGLELHYATTNQELWLIHGRAERFDRPGRLELDRWILTAELRREDAERALAGAGIQFTLRASGPDPFTLTDELRTAAGVSLLFSSAPDAAESDRLLEVITARRPPPSS